MPTGDQIENAAFDWQQEVWLGRPARAFGISDVAEISQA
jgi:hypothetical protein